MTIASTTRTRLLASAAVLAVAVMLPAFAGPASAKQTPGLEGGVQLAQAASGSGNGTLSPSPSTGAPVPSTNPASPTAPAEKVAPPASTTTPGLSGTSASGSKTTPSNSASTTGSKPVHQPSAADTASGKGNPTRAQARIDNLKKQLKITSAQEPQWNALAQVMSDNQQQMEQLYQDRRSKGDTMTAVDDLDSYAKITDAQADNLKKLVPAFQALYDTMSPAQKKTADTLFRHNGRRTAPSHASAKAPAKTATPSASPS